MDRVVIKLLMDSNDSFSFENLNSVIKVAWVCLLQELRFHTEFDFLSSTALNSQTGKGLLKTSQG